MNTIEKISKRAKQLYKKGKSKGKKWVACIKEASREYNSGKKMGGAKKRKPHKTVKKKSYRQTGTSSKQYDRRRKARPPGARIPIGGKKVTYYERRKNRSDVPGTMTGTAYNEMILRNLHMENTLLAQGNQKLVALKEHYKKLPRGTGKNMIKAQIKDQAKFIRAKKEGIRMLKRLIK